MKTPEVVVALGALAHEYRLGIYRMLVERGPEGLPAGTIGERIGLQPSSLTLIALGWPSVETQRLPSLSKATLSGHEMGETGPVQPPK